MEQFSLKVICDNQVNNISCYSGELLCDVLSRGGFTVALPCGKTGRCGKCRIPVIDGRFDCEEIDSDSTVRACRAVVCGDASVEYNPRKAKIETSFLSDSRLVKGVSGFAVDIGTTTVVAACLNSDGSVKIASAVNPQCSFGADIMSRISACEGQGLLKMHNQIVDCINRLVYQIQPDTNPKEMIVSGNTTMLHILRGVSPKKMGFSPFIPEFTDAVFLCGNEIGLNAENVILLPGVSAFIGSDIVAGIFALGLHNTGKKLFLADLGTNGELVFSDCSKIVCTSTAAGPALEGPSLECGTGAVSGAVFKVYLKDDRVTYETVDNTLPCGICGSGIIDSVSVMLDMNFADETGEMKESQFEICDGVYITQKDLRSFQLAKSSVLSGVEILLEESGCGPKEIDGFYISGGLGAAVNAYSAARSGIIPNDVSSCVIPSGNTSLLGALLCIGNLQAVEEMRVISKKCKTINLAEQPRFNEKFIENMIFE